MSTQDSSPVKNAMNYGSIIGIALVIISLLFYMMNETTSEIQNYLGYLALAVGVYIGVKHHRDNELGGLMSYGKALSSGTLISFFASIIMAFYLYVFILFIDPSLVDVILEKAENDMIDAGNSDKEIEMGMKYTMMFVTPFWMSAMSVLVYTIIGFIFSLIIATFLKKQDDSFDSNFQ
ncbi:MAG TPA: DUF4199 domain-containing protein [Flavobacteriales bacterium]|nr:DUF4199 domain-containing protein [Flavobacteriales bacterium]HIA13202.1 DUF4199 domain-containing protein [Flavobacteriales bacterium]